jgi:hypothetical protein
MCRVPAVIIAAVIGGAGLTACAASGSNPSAVASAAALSAAPGSSPTSALTDAPGSTPTPTTSPTHIHSAAAKPSVTAMASVRPKSSPHATTSPHATSPTNTSSGTHNFTVPAIPGDNVVSAWGTYTKTGTTVVKVTMCAKQTGTASAVGALALVYNASGASKNIGAVVLTGPGNTSCVGTTFILYTAHLKVHAFIGDHGNIVKTGPVLTIY